MNVLLFGATLFLVSFMAHVALWRVHRPKRTTVTVIALFVVSNVLMTLLCAFGSESLTPVSAWLPSTPGAWLHALVVGLGLSAAYVMTYPALEVASPTLVIFELLEEAGSSGLSAEELYRGLEDDVLVEPRIRDLLREGFASEVGGRYRISAKGRRLAGVFSAWRHLLGVGLGG